MPPRKAPSIPNELLDELLAGTDPATALKSGEIFTALKKALAERVLNAEMLVWTAPDGINCARLRS